MSEIVWTAANDPDTNAPSEPVTSFPSDVTRITGSVLIAALPAASTLEATWEYNDTSLDAFTRQVALAAPAAETWISFYLDASPGAEWPAGTYLLTISLNGAVERQASVEVTDQN